MNSNLLIALFAFAFTLGLVVIVHELGHFLFCKIFGVYVKTFSIGIGPKVLRKRIGETEYVLSLIPFGGYVKMAGEGVMEEIQDAGTWEERKYPLGTEEGNREAAVSERHIPTDRHFNEKPVWQRLVIFIAGPVFNLLLAFFVYTGIILNSGLLEIPVTRVGRVAAESPAAIAGFEVGDRIVTVGREPVMYWGEIQTGLIEPSETADRRGDPLPVTVAVVRGRERLELQVVPRFDADAGYWVLGLEPWDTVVGLVQKGGPGDKLGLEPGDEILAIDDYEVTSFNDIATVINRNGGREVVVKWLRDGQEISGRVVPLEAEILPDSTIGRIYIDRQYVARDVNLGQALWIGMRATWATMQATLNVLYRFVGGKLGLEAVGGPIRIGQVAGEMLRWSFGHLMQFIAFFSVNLFLLNLLPIPVLDGGHVLFLMFEAIRGKPAPERMQAIATQMGLIILLLFMTFVLVFDVWKVTGH